MNLPFFLALRLAKDKQPSFSQFIIKLSIAATTLSVSAMVVTICFVNGFQEAVADKVFHFWGHIRVQQIELGREMMAEEKPIQSNDTILQKIRKFDAVAHVQPYATKSAVVEKDKDIEGVLLKGYAPGYDTAKLRTFLVSGHLPLLPDSGYSKELMLSKTVANSLQVKLGDTVRLYFIQPGSQTQTGRRKLVVTGIFNTGIEEFDKNFALCDIRFIQRVNNWQPGQIGGYEILLNGVDNLDVTTLDMQNKLPVEWTAKSIKEVMPNIFDWLNIQDTNRNVVFVIMSFVAAINLVTCLLVLVLERTRMIGILKALGCRDADIKRVFLYHASFISIIGTGAGMAIGLGICVLEDITHWIKLDESSYYLSYAPVHIIGWEVFLVGFTTVYVCFCSLSLPALIIKRMNLIRAIQFK